MRAFEPMAGAWFLLAALAAGALLGIASALNRLADAVGAIARHLP